MESDGKSVRTFHSGGAEGFEPLRCVCKYKAVIRISGSKANPGRLYFSCPNFKVSERCDFFRWFDEDRADNHCRHEATSSIRFGGATTMADYSLADMERKMSRIEVNLKGLKVLVLGLYGIMGLFVVVALVLWFMLTKVQNGDEKEQLRKMLGSD